MPGGEICASRPSTTRRGAGKNTDGCAPPTGVPRPLLLVGVALRDGDRSVVDFCCGDMSVVDFCCGDMSVVDLSAEECDLRLDLTRGVVV